jgi:hypothetical protein
MGERLLTALPDGVKENVAEQNPRNEYSVPPVPTNAKTIDNSVKRSTVIAIRKMDD